MSTNKKLQEVYKEYKRNYKWNFTEDQIQDALCTLVEKYDLESLELDEVLRLTYTITKFKQLNAWNKIKKDRELVNLYRNDIIENLYSDSYTKEQIKEEQEIEEKLQELYQKIQDVHGIDVKTVTKLRYATIKGKPALTLKKIADMLGVSVSKIKRDLAKGEDFICKELGIDKKRLKKLNVLNRRRRNRSTTYKKRM